MFERAEAFFKGLHDTKLFYQIWKPKVSKGSLVITHGQSEHSECYLRLIAALEGLDLTIYAWDLRGHGRSEGKRGYAEKFTDYKDDLVVFLKHLQSVHAVDPKKTTLLSHSMGGLIQTLTLCENPNLGFSSQVLASPMFGVAVDVPIYKDIGALVFDQLWPTMTMGNEISFANLTRDIEIQREYQKDVLRHGKISAGVYLGSIIAMEGLRKSVSVIRIPTLLQIPEKDPVVDSEQARKIFALLGSKDKTKIEYPDRMHELYNDFGRDLVYKDLIAFLKAHI